MLPGKTRRAHPCVAKPGAAWPAGAHQGARLEPSHAPGASVRAGGAGAWGQQVGPRGRTRGSRTHLKTRNSRQAMSSAVKAHATITAAFRVGRSRSRLEMRVTRVSPLLLELLPPPPAVQVAFPGPGPGCGGAADSALLARAPGAARSASSSSSGSGSGSWSGSGSGAARMVRAEARARRGARRSPGSRASAEACTGAPAAEAAARGLAGSCGARKSPRRRRHQHVARSHSTGRGPTWAGQATRPGACCAPLAGRPYSSGTRDPLESKNSQAHSSAGAVLPVSCFISFNPKTSLGDRYLSSSFNR